MVQGEVDLLTDQADRRSVVSSYVTRMVPGVVLVAVLALLAALLPGPRLSTSTAGEITRADSTSGDPRFPDAKKFARIADAGGSGVLRGGAGSGAGVPGGGTAAASGNTYQGVSADTILVGGTSQLDDCGGANPANLAPALGVEYDPKKNEYLLYELPAKYFTKYGVADYLDSFPLPPDVAANTGHGKGFWGRKIKHKFYDDGGFACPEKGRAAAVKLAEQDKVFSLIRVGTGGNERVQATVFARHKLPFVGIYGLGPRAYQDLAPYTYNGHHVADYEQVIALASLACRDYVNKKATNTGDPVVNGMPRKFGLIHDDLPEVNEVKDILLAEVAKCGIKPEVASFPLDASQVAAVAGPTMARFRSAGVTTILNMIDFFFIQVYTSAATNQNYFPEWLNSGYLLQDWSIIIQEFWDDRQSRNIVGAVSGRLDTSITAGEGSQSPGAKASRKIAPNEPTNSGADIIYDNWFLWALGVAGAGRNLTAQTWKEGLMRLCNPCPRKDPLGPLRWISSANDYQMFSDFTILKWNPTKIDNWGSIDTRTNKKRVGFWDHPEGGKRYIGTVYNPE